MLILLGACATPAEKFDRLARAQGFQRHVLAGERFQHVVYAREGEGRTLHVYLSGDGTPWRNRSSPALDPTPRRALVLSLMAIDPAPSILLGRPCYHGLARAPGCSVWQWTAARYSTEVVSSSVQALVHWVDSRDVDALAIIGYSGGGVLALLLSEQWEQRRQLQTSLPAIREVVTIAANLDIDRWTALHAYSPLLASLNPATQAPLPESIKQWHLVGGQDQNVPPWLVEEALGQRGGGPPRVFPDNDHVCCWEDSWEALLGEFGLRPRG